MKNFKTIFLLFLLAFPCSVFARIWLPSVLSDGMVLQQQSQVRIWGWSTEGQDEITVTGSWDNAPVTVTADVGLWEVILATPAAGGPYEITISGHQTLVLKDVLIGEVWVCSGQSNMEWSANAGIDNAAEEIAAADYPQIRFFDVPRRRAETPQDDVPGDWTSCTPETMQDFSAVAYFFARKLHKASGVPIGLISSNWGGTPVESWIPEEAYEDQPELLEAAMGLKKFPWWPVEVGSLYNGMVHPIEKMSVKGVIWYQGESNRENIPSYYESFPLLIDSWREFWGEECSFYFVQLAPYKYDDPKGRSAAVVRDAQLHTLKTVSNTGMAVTTDIGNLEDIHPRNKQEVGRRLALWAMARDYGREDVTFSGPIYRSMERSGKRVRLRFDHAGSGLMMKGKALTDFEVAGPDKQFYPAKARINGDEIEVWSREVDEPAAVRFGFTNGAEPNLFNKEGLPASPFRTDRWEVTEE